MSPQSSEPRRRARQLWTTGQLADLIGFSPKTIATWIDSRELYGVTMPGVLDRRVHRSALREFLRRYDYYWALAKLDCEEGLITPEQLKAVLSGRTHYAVSPDERTRADNSPVAGAGRRPRPIANK